jgi:hypothetical protein
MALNSLPNVPPPPAINYFPAAPTTGAQVQLTNSATGQTYYGQISTYPQPVDPLAIALAGRQAAQADEQYQQAERARSNLFYSCMYSRGWEERTASTAPRASAAPGPMGSRCTVDAHCAGRLVCLNGICAELRTGALGDPCSRHDQCAGLLICRNGVCAARDSLPAVTGQGVDAQSAGPGMSCRANSNCAYRLICVGGRCSQYPNSVQRGASCSFDSECANGLFCSNGKCQ